MRHILMVIVMSVVLLSGCITSNSNYKYPDVSRVYDKDHHHVGFIYHNKYQTRYYDKDLHLIGYSK